MKKVLLAAIASGFLLSSCTKDMENSIFSHDYENINLQTRSLTVEEDFQIVDYKGEACIQFKNDSIFKEFLSKTIYKSIAEKRNIFSKLGFVSQIDIMEQAEKEQEAIVDNYEKDLNQAFPDQQIKSFKQKYSDVFLFNPYDSTDFIPNYKNSMYRYFINRQGLFLIGDSVVNVPQHSIEEIFGSTITTLGSNEHTSTSSINKAETKYQIPGGDYVKVRAIPEYVGFYLNAAKKSVGVYGLELLSQKKKVLWKKHHADIFLTYNLKSVGYSPVNMSKIVEIKYTANSKKIPVYGKIPADSNPMYEVAPSAIDNNYKLNGTLEIWSNEIPIKGYTTIKCTAK